MRDDCANDLRMKGNVVLIAGLIWRSIVNYVGGHFEFEEKRFCSFILKSVMHGNEDQFLYTPERER